MMKDRNILTRYAALRHGFDGETVDPRAWLTAAEQVELARFRDPVRRRQWLAGRWVAKQLVGEACDHSELADVQILSRDQRGLGSRPQIQIGSQFLAWSLSIAHTERGVLAALDATGQSSVGVDLTSRVPCDARFQQLWFTADERRWINDESQRASAIWSIKEAVYKACQTGQGWSPRLVEVLPSADDWFACTFDGQPVNDLQLNVRDFDGQVATVACVPADVAAEPWPFETIYHTDLSLASCL